MAKTRQEKGWWDYHDEIEALKERRAEAWRALLPDDPHAAEIAPAHEGRIRAAAARNAGNYPPEHDAESLAHLHYATFLAREAEAHPDVLAIDAALRRLRAEQLAFCDEPDYAVEPARPGSRDGEGWKEMAVTHSDGMANNTLDNGFKGAFNTTGVIKIYSGSAPGANNAVTGTLLSTLTFSATAFGAAASRVAATAARPRERPMPRAMRGLLYCARCARSTRT